MTVSYRSSPVAKLVGDQWFHFEPPYQGPPGEAGGLGGGGGALACEVTVSSTEYLVFNENPGGGQPVWGGGTLPPSGKSYPGSQPTRTGSEHWHPTGFHGYGRTAFSPNWGYIVTGITGMRSDGVVDWAVNACYNVHEAAGFETNSERRWRFMGTQPNGDTTSNSFSNFHTFFGYDSATGNDLVCLSDDQDLYKLTGATLAQLPGTIPQTLTKVWDMPAGAVTAGCRLTWSNYGVHREELPWRNEWWIYDSKETSPGASPILWKLTLNSDGSTLSTSWAEITLPTAVTSKLAAESGTGSSTVSGPRANFSFCVDTDNRRVIAYMTDPRDTPSNTGEGDVTSRYPLHIWTVDPTDPSNPASWVEITLPTPMYVTEISARCRNPMVYRGGCRFLYFDVYTLSDVGNQTAYTSSGHLVSAGGFVPKEIFLRNSSTPRAINVAAHTVGAGTISYTKQASLDVREIMQSKHVEAAYDPASGRIFLMGGDPGISDGSGSNGSGVLWSIDPETTDYDVEYDPAANSHPVYPLRVDENGFQYRPTDGCFWHKTDNSAVDFGTLHWVGWEDTCTAGGGSSANTETAGDAAAYSAWVAAGGGYFLTGNAGVDSSVYGGRTSAQGKVWRYNPSTHVWTSFHPTAAVGSNAATLGITFTAGEGRKAKHWYYDTVSDKFYMCAWEGDPNGVFTGVPLLYVYDPVANTFECGRIDYDDTTSASVLATMSVGELSDRQGVDPTTGYIYFTNWKTGYIYRIDPRGGLYTGSGGHKYYHMRRLLRGPTQFSINLWHAVYSNGAMWFAYEQTATPSRVRLFSYKESTDSQLYEHYVPPYMQARTWCSYGTNKIFAWGTTCEPGQMQPMRDHRRTYYVIQTGT